MAVWRSTPVAQTPCLEVMSWSIRRLPDGDHHIVGFNITELEGRVSSKIVAFDPALREADTRSGRRYRLIGNPGFNHDAEYTWSRWLEMHNLKKDETTVLKEGEIDRLQISP